MSNIGNILMGSGFVDEGIEFERLEEEIAKLKKQLSSSIPSCPKCRQIMTPRHYHGYYEDFAFWECECSDLKDRDGFEKSYGSYA